MRATCKSRWCWLKGPRRKPPCPCCQAQLLDMKHVGDGPEVGERRRVGDDVNGVGEAAVETMQKVEHKLRVGDEMPDLP